MPMLDRVVGALERPAIVAAVEFACWRRSDSRRYQDEESRGGKFATSRVALYVALYTGVQAFPWGSLHQQVVPLGDAALLLTH
jgi:hypothetical protein